MLVRKDLQKNSDIKHDFILINLENKTPEVMKLGVVFQNLEMSLEEKKKTCKEFIVSNRNWALKAIDGNHGVACVIDEKVEFLFTKK